MDGAILPCVKFDELQLGSPVRVAWKKSVLQRRPCAKIHGCIRTHLSP